MSSSQPTLGLVPLGEIQTQNPDQALAHADALASHGQQWSLLISARTSVAHLLSGLQELGVRTEPGFREKFALAVIPNAYSPDPAAKPRTPHFMYPQSNVGPTVITEVLVLQNLELIAGQRNQLEAILRSAAEIEGVIFTVKPRTPKMAHPQSPSAPAEDRSHDPH